MKVNEFFNLTTKEGRDNAMESLLCINPLLYFGKKILDSVIDKDQSSMKDQHKIAEDLILKGKEQGVKNMRIKLKSDKGFKLSVPIEGVNIDTKAGSDNEIEVEVSYA
ncbi:MAG: hypothetical protein J1F43_03630 [Muribaculaceae bacterium]|nr:hypothetical protein [Muribaculaceae bacterium]